MAFAQSEKPWRAKGALLRGRGYVRLVSSGNGSELGSCRLVEQYDSLVELDVAVFVRGLSGWAVLSAGEVRPGRWWAEFERLDGAGAS